MDYKTKYFKYKNKYLHLKKMIGGTTLVSFDCPVIGCKMRHENIDIDEIRKFECTCSKTMYPRPINVINNLMIGGSLIRKMEETISLLKTDISNFAIHVGKGESSINKCKYINNEELNADIIMNYDTRQKTTIYDHNTINAYISGLNRASDIEPYYFCFLLSQNGLKLARVNDVLEYGASHMMMSDRGEEIIVAGELKIEGTKIIYNFESGSVNYGSLVSKYAKNGLCDLHPKSNVGDYMTRIPFFYIYDMLAKKLLLLSLPGFTLEFTPKHLIAELEKKGIKKETVEKICRNDFDKLTTYQIKHPLGEEGDSYNRCTKNSFFTMKDGDGKLNYAKLDADISTMSLFRDKQSELVDVSNRINDNKILNIPNVASRSDEIPTKKFGDKYKEFLLCKDV